MLVLLALFLAPFAGAAKLKEKAAKRDVPEQLRWNEHAWGPMVPHKKFPRDCGLCHVPKRWDVLRPDFRYDHKKETGYALEGAHAGAACLRCHNDRGPVAVFKARGCAGCHVDPHKSAMGLDCRRCHGQDDWELRGAKGDRVAEHARTRFPLVGMHVALRCDQCHTKASMGDFRGAPLDCLQCHRDRFLSAPNHAAKNYPRDCQSCHKSVGWEGAVFSHAAIGASGNCVSCHLANYQSAPNHAAQGYAQTCGSCHSQQTWKPALHFDHAAVSGGASQNCMNCHHGDFLAATSPIHHTAQGIIEASCSQCHSNASLSPVWQPTSFTHNPSSCYNSATHKSHKSATCVKCHASGNYQTATCTACHSNRSNCD